VRAHETEIFSQLKSVDVLVALNKETVDIHLGELSGGAGIVYDGEEFSLDDLKSRDVRLYPVPFSRLLKEAGGEAIMKNNVALGASIALIDYDFEILKLVIADTFKRKGEKVITDNQKASQAGYDYVRKAFGNDFRYKLKKAGGRGKMLLTGNDAISMGAIAAGCKFYAAYPMTPASSILHFMAAQERRFGIVVKHSEDEIAAINMAIGAGFAGVRAMVGTSGGGFCLMSEGFGLAGMIEVPIVVIEGQRPGPSTGMPTWTAQGDARFVLGASQDDFPRIIIAPGDIEECFYFTAEAFNLAEKYQTPVMILTDKYLAESHRTTPKFDTGKIRIERGATASADATAATQTMHFFKRYMYTATGISPRSIPPQKGGMYTATSDEHDEEGNITEEIEDRVKMMDKRMAKLDMAAKELRNPGIIGPQDADITIVGWGSTKFPILEAMKMLSGDKISVNYLQLVYLSPFPAQDVASALGGAKRTLMVENNYSAQVAGLIREKTGILIKDRLLKYDGRPFFPEEIIAKVKEVAAR